jgi:hypothetical protein
LAFSTGIRTVFWKLCGEVKTALRSMSASWIGVGPIPASVLLAPVKLRWRLPCSLSAPISA